MERLDVGCGNVPTGDVNVDLYTNHPEQRWPRLPVDTRRIRNFVLADALHLPFRDKTFRHVYSRAVIEHVADPVLFLKEVIRVSSRKVTVITPHRYGRHALSLHQTPVHINFFNVKWFDRVLRKFSHVITARTEPKPHLLLPLVQWPGGLTVEVYL